MEFLIAGKAHLREALVLHDESQRLQRMCRDLKGKKALARVLKKAQETTLDSYNRFGSEDDFRELLDPPDIIGTFPRQRAHNIINFCLLHFDAYKLKYQNACFLFCSFFYLQM